MTLSTVEKALALAKIGLHVFPWHMSKDGRKSTYKGTRGHLDATTDPEAIATAFTEHADPRIGVHVGASGLVVADLDRKNDKDGFTSSEGWLDFPATFFQETPSNGIHHIYAAPEGTRLAPAADFQGFTGLDVRGGSSWIGWYGDVPADRTVFSPAPDWLLEPARQAVGGAFEGGLDEWLSTLVDPSGEPTGRVLDAISRIPEGEFGHPQLIEREFEFVRLAAEGHPGVLHGLELLRTAWLRPPWDGQDYAYEFDAGLAGAVAKFGALEDRIASLPKYSDLLLAETHPEVTNLLAAVDGKGKGDKGHWTRTLNTLIRFGYTDDDAASALWSAPSTKDLSREWGIEFVYTRVTEAREKHAEQDARAAEEASQVAKVSPVESNHTGLLTDEERAYLADHPTFIDRYVDYAATRFNHVNEPYHRANAWTILSLVYGGIGFVPLAGKKLSLNLFQMSPGESSTGKSDSIILRDEILRLFFADDLGYDVGSEASPEVLHEEMLLRTGHQTFFNSDEAAGFFRKLAQNGSWNAGLEDKITDWYGGYVGPVNKRVSKAVLKDANRGGPCYLVSHFFATPDRLFNELTTDQFLSGFLARFQWSFGEGAVESDARFWESQADSPEAHRDTAPEVEEMVAEFHALRAHVGLRRPLLAGPEELKRLSKNRRVMEAYLRANTDWKITESAYRRLCDALRKASALLALSRGSTRIEMVDVLATIQQAEMWLEGLAEAASRVSASVFEREAREIAHAVRTMGHPWVTESRLSNRFSQYDDMDWRRRIDWGIRQGLITKQEGNREHGTRFGWRGGEREDEE